MTVPSVPRFALTPIRPGEQYAFKVKIDGEVVPKVTVARYFGPGLHWGVWDWREITKEQPYGRIAGFFAEDDKQGLRQCVMDIHCVQTA
jgi:hypothetical protein